MTPPIPPHVSAAVEGSVDRVVVERLLNESGLPVGPIYGMRGKAHLRRNLRAYNHSATHFWWTVLVDLDHDADCAPALITEWLPRPAPFMCLQVAVREIEAWLLADTEQMARFLSVPRHHLPERPETLENAKRLIVDLARRSRRIDIRRGLVPRDGSGREVGAAFAASMVNFATRFWRPEVAEARSDSLRRYRRRLAGIRERITP